MSDDYQSRLRRAIVVRRRLRAELIASEACEANCAFAVMDQKSLDYITKLKLRIAVIDATIDHYERKLGRGWQMPFAASAR